MVSEKPPRRSKTNKEPVTIDMTAEETPAVAEPVRANDSDELIPPPDPAAIETTDAKDTVEPVNEPFAEAEATNSETPRFDEAEPAVAASPEPEPEKATEQEPATAEADGLPPISRPEERSTRYNPAEQTQPELRQPQRSAPATSTLVAAGIFGGIVALLLAGSMQYAGFLPGTSSSAPASNEGDVSAELASLRQEVAALANRPADTSGDLAGRVAALESSASSGGSDELVQRLSTIEGELSNIKSATEAAAASDADLAGRLQQAEAKINDRGPEQQAARAVAAAALKGAIDRGGSFEAELKTYEAVAGGDPSIAQLQPFATKGVLSRIELQRQASTVADGMIEAVSQPDPEQGIASRLLSSAMSVVKVRKVGDVQGDTPDAIVARFEDRLRSGDLPAAAREWEALPEPAKAASQPFKQELDARIQVENLVGGTLTRAIAGTQG